MTKARNKRLPTAVCDCKLVQSTFFNKCLVSLLDYSSSSTVRLMTTQVLSQMKNTSFKICLNNLEKRFDQIFDLPSLFELK